MSTALADIRALSIAERIQLVQDIWDTIAAEPERVPITEAQRQELDRRIGAYRRDRDGGAPWPEVRARITTRR